MKFAHITAFAIVAMIGTSTLGAPAHAGFLGKVLGLPNYSGVQKPQTHFATPKPQQAAPRDPMKGVDYSWVKPAPSDPMKGVSMKGIDYSWVKR